MNDIYINFWNPLQNYFLPTYKLTEKIRVGGMIRKKYGRPETPYTRLINSLHLSEAQKEGQAKEFTSKGQLSNLSKG